MQYVCELVREKEGKYYLPSPALPLDLAELDEEGYRWFFQILKEEKKYPHIFVGLGNIAMSKMYTLQIFDRLLVIDSKENRHLHDFYDRLEGAAQSDYPFFKGNYERVYREDILYEPS